MQFNRNAEKRFLHPFQQPFSGTLSRFPYIRCFLIWVVLFNPLTVKAQDIEALVLANVNKQALIQAAPWQDDMVLLGWRDSLSKDVSWQQIPDPLSFFNLLLNSNQNKPLLVTGELKARPIQVSTSLTLPFDCLTPVPSGIAPKRALEYWEMLLSDDEAVTDLLEQWAESQHWGFWLWLFFQRSENAMTSGDDSQTDTLVAQARSKISQLQDPQLSCLQLNYEGRFWLKHKRYELARSAFENAVSQGIAANVGEPVLAELYFQLGSAQWFLAAYTSSFSSWKESLKHQQGFLDDHPRRGRTLNALGMVAVRLDALDQAETYLLEAERLRKNWDAGGLTLASTHNNLGILYGKRGHITAAEAQFRKALSIRKHHIPQSSKIATLLNNLGLLAVIREDWSLAGSYFEEALAIGLAKGAPPTHISSSYLNVGKAHLALGRLSKANNAFSKALTLLEKHFPNSLEEASGHLHLGRVLFEKGSLKMALVSLSRAVELFQHTTAHGKGLADARLARAKVLFSLNKLAEAETDGRFALSIYELTTSSSRALAETQFLLGNIAKANSNDILAIELWLEGLETLEAQFLFLGGAYQVGARFLEAFSDYYGKTLDHLIQQGDIAEAFLLSERYRSQAFLLDRARKLALQESPKTEALHHQLTTINQAMEQTYRAWQKEAKATVKAEEHLLQLKRLREEKAHIKQAWLTKVRPKPPLSHHQIGAYLPENTLLVSFVVNDLDTHAFTLNHVGKLTHKRLPVGFKALGERVQDFRRFLATPKLRNRFLFEGEAQALYQRLFQPLTSQLSNVSRLLVVPDGPLHELPFGALIPEQNAGIDKYLGDRWSFSLLPSGTFLGRNSTKKPSPAYELMAVGSPFQLQPEPGDTNTVESQNQGTSLFFQLTRSLEKDAHRQGDQIEWANVLPFFPEQSRSSVRQWLASSAHRNQFGPLPFSTLEVNSIAKLFPQDKVKIFQHKAATKVDVMAHLNQARFLHFSCHSHIQQQTPFLSALVLAHNDATQKSDWLHAWEIEEKGPLAAELAVLSACETALGPDSGGNGLLSLTQSFHLAGIPCVAASLWPISDLSTAILMNYFYKNLHAGFPRDVALQKAQQRLRQTQHSLELDLGHPYWWAGIQIYGRP